jgi:hypothetical protein
MPVVIDTTISILHARVLARKPPPVSSRRLASSRVVYVSCDVATAARDARVLLDHGYGLKSLRVFDMFPNTAHIETLMLFER